MALLRRRIDVTFFLQRGNFSVPSPEPSPVAKVSGVRAHIEIEHANGPSMGTAQARIYGLTLSMMNDLTPIQPFEDGAIVQRKNDILIEAGDNQNGMAIAFLGQITLAPIDMNDLPNSALTVVAHTGAFAALQKIPPSSYPGSASVGQIMQNLATLAGWKFENNDIPLDLPVDVADVTPSASKIQLATPYLPGSLFEQARACAAAANINMTLDPTTNPNTLAIWTKESSRGGTVQIVDADHGMVGYPVQWSSGGVYVKTLYNPLLRPGIKVDVRSANLKFANGRFMVQDIRHELDAETPNGLWFSMFHASPLLNG